MRKKIEIQDDPRVEDYFWKIRSDLRDEIKKSFKLALITKWIEMA